MFLRDINVRSCVTDGLINKTNLNYLLIKTSRVFIDANHIEELFLKKLKKTHTGQYCKINIYLSKTDEFKTSFVSSDVLDCFIGFDFENYDTLNYDKDKKREILNIMLKALMLCAEKFNWDKNNFLDAYNEVIAEGIKNEWFFKNKLFRSTNREYFAGLYCIYDMQSYRVYLKIFDRKKNEISERLVFKDKFKSFYFEWIKWSDDCQTVFYKFDGPKKIFEAKVSDLLLGAEYNFPENTTQFFK